MSYAARIAAENKAAIQKCIVHSIEMINPILIIEYKKCVDVFIVCTS